MGTSDGFVYFYNMCNLHTNTKYIVDHMEYIQSVQLLRDGVYKF